MGRKAGLTSNWRLRLPEGRTVYICRITHNGRTSDHSTGSSDPVEATQAGARIYADHVQRNPQRRAEVRRGNAPPLVDLLATWLETDNTIDPDTVSTWECYARRYIEQFTTLADVTEVTATAYRGKRLGQVQATTVRKELSTLRRFLKWCQLHGYLHRAVVVPGVPAKATGTKHTQRRRVAAPELTPGEVAAFLAALPEWSGSQWHPPMWPRPSRRQREAFPIRSRFIFAYETGLRPGALDMLSIPEHWQPGATTLKLSDDADKIRWGRELPLTQNAIVALTVAAPEEGLIFGVHDYREYVATAAAASLPPHKAAIFTGAHLRSAITTHELERTGNLLGVQYLRGHKQATTTAKYARASMRAALAVHSRGRNTITGDGG